MSFSIFHNLGAIVYAGGSHKGIKKALLLLLWCSVPFFLLPFLSSLSTMRRFLVVVDRWNNTQWRKKEKHLGLGSRMAC